MPIPLGILAVAGAGAAGGAGSYELIESAYGTGSSATITFSNIPQTYKHLQIRMTSKTTTASTGNRDLYLRFNGDSGSNYSSHELRGTGSAFQTVAATSQNQIQMSVATIESNNIASSVPVIIDILDFSNASKNTTTRALYGFHGSNSVHRIMFTSGLWMNTNAVTSLTITNELAQNFSTISRFSLYGIKG